MDKIMNPTKKTRIGTPCPYPRPASSQVNVQLQCMTAIDVVLDNERKRKLYAKEREEFIKNYKAEVLKRERKNLKMTTERRFNTAAFNQSLSQLNGQSSSNTSRNVADEWLKAKKTRIIKPEKRKRVDSSDENRTYNNNDENNNMVKGPVRRKYKKGKRRVFLNNVNLIPCPMEIDY